MTIKAIGNKVRNYLLSHDETIAVAESVTSGHLQALFSAMPDAQKYYHGGITAYNIGQKYKHLNIEPVHAQNVNCVSLKVAQQMAINVCHMFQSQWGIGITGYATPVPESGNKIFCYYAISYRSLISTSGIIDSRKIAPQLVQVHFANTILEKFLEVISTHQNK